MRRLLIVLAITVVTACDAPWAGPSTPDGGRSLNLTTLATHGPYTLTGEAILASTSLAAIRAEVISLALGQSNAAEDELCRPDTQLDVCWRQQVDRPGRLYIGVITPNMCNVDVKESAAIAGRTLYFIRWIGHPKGVCNAAMAVPNWRLFSAARADLPSAGILTVRLQMQGATNSVAAESQVELT